MIYLIKEISIDESENEYSKAVTFHTLGYVESIDHAQRIINDSDNYTGTGWPIDKGEIIKTRKYESILPFDALTYLETRLPKK
jgi:hypothetical protein